MTPKKATAASGMVVVKPPVAAASEMNTTAKGSKKTGKKAAGSLVKKPKPRLKPLNILKIKIRDPKESEVPDIEDSIVEHIIMKERVNSNEPQVKRKRLKPKLKPPSYPKKLNKVEAMTCANEVALAQLVKSSIAPQVTKTKEKKPVKRRIRKAKPKLESPLHCNVDTPSATYTEENDEVTVATTVPKSAKKRTKKPKEILHDNEVTKTKELKEDQNVMIDENTTPKLKATRKRAPKRKMVTENKKPPAATLEDQNALIDENTTPKLKATRKRAPKRKMVTENKKTPAATLEDQNVMIDENTTPKLKATRKRAPKRKMVTENKKPPAATLEDTLAPTVESTPVVTDKRRGRPRLLRNKVSPIKVDKGEQAELVNTVKTEPNNAVAVKTRAKRQQKNHDNEVQTASRATSISDRLSSARDVSTASERTSSSVKSFEIMNGKVLAVEVVDCKKGGALKLKRNRLESSTSSETTNFGSNITDRNPPKLSTTVVREKQIDKSTEVDKSTEPPNKKKKVTNGDPTLVANPETTAKEKRAVTEKSKLLAKKIVDSSRRNVSNSCGIISVGSRKSFPVEVDFTTFKNTEKNKEGNTTPENSCSSKITSTSSISIPTSAISKITGTEKSNMDAAVKKLAQILKGVDLEFIDWGSKFSCEEIHEDKNIMNKLKQTPLKYLELEIKCQNKCKEFRLSEKFSSIQNESPKSSISNDELNELPVEDIKSFPNEVNNSVEEPKTEDNNPAVDMSYTNFQEDTFENNKEHDSFSDIVRQKSYEQRLCRDDDDLISLFAESLSGFESSKGNSNFISAFQHAENHKSNSENIEKPFKIPKLLNHNDETSVKPKQPAATTVIKNKTKIVCEKQNADSTSVNKEDRKNILLEPKLILPEKSKGLAPPIVSDVQQQRSLLKRYSACSFNSSFIFKGYCLYFIIGRCRRKRPTYCNFEHKKPSPMEVQNKLSSLANDAFIAEYLLVKQYPALSNNYLLCFALCSRGRGLNLLLEMATESISEERTLRSTFLETTLLELYKKPLNTIKDSLLAKSTDGTLLCDYLMKTIAETLNFTRFKDVFLSLTELMVQENRKFDLDVATQLLERIRILPFDENVNRALVQIMKNTDPAIFKNALMPSYEAMLYHKNRELCQSLIELKNNILMSMEQPVSEFHEDNFNTENFIQGNNVGLQNITGHAAVEKQRYTSPDTTHLDTMQHKPVADPPLITRTVDFNNQTRTYLLSTPPGGPRQNYASSPAAAATTSSGEPPYQRSNYIRPHQGMWIRGNDRSPRLQPNLFRPPPPKFGTRWSDGLPRMQRMQRGRHY